MKDGSAQHGRIDSLSHMFVTTNVLFLFQVSHAYQAVQQYCARGLQKGYQEPYAALPDARGRYLWCTLGLIAAHSIDKRHGVWLLRNDKALDKGSPVEGMLGSVLGSPKCSISTDVNAIHSPVSPSMPPLT